MTTSLRHTPHPLQFSAIEVISPRYLSPTVVDTFLALLKIITVIAAIGIDSLIVEFKDDRADTIEEETVVSHHQKRLVTTTEETFQPLNHLKVEVVGRLVENQKVWFCDEHIGQCHALLLSAGELSHRLREITNLQLGEDLFGFQYLFLVAMMIKARIEHTLGRVEDWRLFEHTHTQVPTENDISAIIALHTGEDGEQCRLARAVLRYQSHFLPFGNRETDVVEQY